MNAEHGVMLSTDLSSPQSIPYFLWDIGYKYGNVQMISNFSILTPFINILTTSLLYNYDLLNGPIFGAIILIAAIV